MMKRRDLLKAAGLAGLLPFAAGRAFAAQAREAFRRVRPGDKAWPSPSDWRALRQALRGELLRPTDLAAACRAAPDGAACADLRAHLGNPFFIGDQPSGTQVSGWFKAWTPAPSAYAIAAQGPSDVAAAVDFARRHRLRLVVKGGAHSYQGTSNAPDSLLVWTRPMREVRMIENFTPEGGDGKTAPVPAVSVEAGAVWIDVYDLVTVKGGRFVLGGGCTTVGVAGHVQSGGFGSFSKGFGTAAGSLLEAEIVTADGRVRLVNPWQDPELFWAVKGGGGGSFGVVTRVVLRTHELPSHLGAAHAVIRARSETAYRALVERFIAFYREALFNPHWGESVQIRGDDTLKIGMVCQGLDEAAMKSVWQPFLDWVGSKPDDYASVEETEIGTSPSPRYWWDVETRKARGSQAFAFDDRPGAPVRHAWWRDDQEQVGAFLWGYDSLWLPASLLADERRLADALVAASRRQTVALHFNKGLAGAPEAMRRLAADTATNPAMIEAFALAIIATGGASRYPGLPGQAADDEAAEQGARSVDAAMGLLAPLAPQAGSYVSESNYFNPDWAEAFWGENYPRLLAAKRQYDPQGLFFVHHGVGSEDWSADGFTRL